MLAWYRELISLRGRVPGVRSGRRQRAVRLGDVLVVVNAGVALVLDLAGHALPADVDPTAPATWADSPEGTPPGGLGPLLASFPTGDGGDAVRVFGWEDRADD